MVDRGKDEAQKAEVELEEEREVDLGQALVEDAHSMLYPGANEWMNDAVSRRYPYPFWGPI